MEINAQEGRPIFEINANTQTELWRNGSSKLKIQINPFARLSARSGEALKNRRAVIMGDEGKRGESPRRDSIGGIPLSLWNIFPEEGRGFSAS